MADSKCLGAADTAARARNRRDAATSTTTAEPYDHRPHTLTRETFRTGPRSP
jgi:hypothetical protein